MSFKFKTILLFLAVSIIPYTLTMLMLGSTLREEQSRSVAYELQTQLAITKERINQSLERLKDDLLFMARSEVMSDIYSDDLDRRISRMLQSKKESLGLIGDFVLVRGEGMVVASSDFGRIGTLFEGESLYEAPVLSVIDGLEAGVLRVSFDSKNLEHFFNNSPTRHYYIEGHDGSVMLRKQAFEQSISSKTPIEALHVTLVLEESKASAYRLLHTYERWFAVTLGIGMVLIILVALGFAITLIKPIIALSRTARQITQTQDYTTEVEVNRSDEIGELGLSFNRMIQGMDRALREIVTLNNEIEETQREVVFTMGAIGESRSKETGNHVKRVAEYSKLLALYYGLSMDEAELLKQASPMHDIGKVAIPDAILNKPGRFTDEEFERMKKHAQLGFEMLKGSNRPLLRAAAIVAHEHHEKYDGSGYPRGLKGEQIHIYGRITALADVFDALGSDRVYKKAWDNERIFALFKEERGKHFDPRLIDLFFEHLDAFLAIKEEFRDLYGSEDASAGA